MIASTTASALEYKDFFSAEITIIAAVIGALAALVGTIAGSLVSFKLQDEANKRKEIKKQIAVGHKTIFTIYQQIDELTAIKIKRINPIKSHPNRFIALPALPPLITENSRYDFDNLSFLLETKHRGILMDLSLTENKFQNLAWLFRARYDFHTQVVQPLLNQAGIGKDKNKTEYTFDEIKDVLSPMAIGRLTVHTDNLIEFLDLTLPALQETSDKLSIALRELYPKETIIGIRSKQQTNSTPSL